MGKTTNLGLHTTATNETSKTFLEYRTELSGTGADSNMNIIDKAYGDMDDKIDANKQAETDKFSTLDGTVSGIQSSLSQEVTARTSGDQLLQSQIDQIVAPSGTIDGASAAEVENARVGVDATTYASLGEAIRGQVSNLNNDLSTANNNQMTNFEVVTGNRALTFKKGYYTSQTTGFTDETISYRYRTDTKYVCSICPCAPGDTFTVNVYSPAGVVRGYFFVDENMVHISHSGGSQMITEYITAPENAHFAVFNNDTSKLATDYYAFKGPALYLNAFKYKRILTANDDLDNINEVGWYVIKSDDTPINAPKNASAVLIVFRRNSTSVTQFYKTVANIGSPQFRNTVGGGWTNWELIATVSMIDKYDTYSKNGIYMYSLSSLNDVLLSGGSVTSNGITFSYVSGDKNKISLSLSGTASAEESAYINLVTGSSFDPMTKLWIRIDKKSRNDNVYVRTTASTGTNFIKSEYYTTPGSGVFRLVVKAGTKLENYIVTCAIQSAPSNAELEQMVTDVDVVENNSIPSYYEEDDYLNSKIDTILKRNLYTNGDSFVFITDYHAHKNAGNSLAIIKELYKNAGISKVFCGGDIGTSTGINGIKTNSKAVKDFQEITPNFYACVGNHEWKVSDNSTPSGTFNSVYNYYINQMESCTSCMSDFGDFWFDSKGAKVRYFFLNQTIEATLTDISLKWFIQELPKVPAGYGIVVVMHHAYHSKTYSTVSSRKYFGMLNWYDNIVGLRNLTVRRISQILYAVKTRSTVKYALRPYTGSTIREKQITPCDHTSSEKNSCGDYNPLLSTFAEGTNTGAYTDIVTFNGASMNSGVYPIAIFCGHKHEDAAYDPATATSFDEMVDDNTVYLLNDTWYRYDSDETSETYGQRVAMLRADGAENLTQTETVPPILVILTTTDCYALNHPDTDPTVREIGTVSEQAFDVVQIDTDARKVYCSRIGAGTDRVFSF